MNDIELYNKAVKEWQRYCERKGYGFDMPSEDASEISGTWVYLRTTDGDLALYDNINWRISERPSESQQFIRISARESTPALTGEVVGLGESWVNVCLDSGEECTFDTGVVEVEYFATREEMAAAA